MYRHHLWYKAASIFNTLTLVFQVFYPVLLYPIKPATAATDAPLIEFDKKANSFELALPGDNPTYTVYYLRDGDILESAGGVGSGAKYAGTCSEGGTCTPHAVKRGILKWSTETSTDAVRFTLDKGKLTIVTQYNSTSQDLTGEEEAWLHGTDTSPPPPYHSDPHHYPNSNPRCHPAIVFGFFGSQLHILFDHHH